MDQQRSEQHIDSPAQYDDDLQTHLITALNNLRYRELEGLFLDQPAAQEFATQTFIVFAIAGEEFAVNAKHFCEVFTDVPIAPMPNSPELLVGLVNLRGQLLPVFQLHGLLAENRIEVVQKPLRKKTVLVIGRGERAVGLLIDALPVSLSLAMPSGIKPARSDVVPHPKLPELAQLHLLPDRTLVQLSVEQLPEGLLRMTS
jgi:chemotaxis signal transduction protein